VRVHAQNANFDAETTDDDTPHIAPNQLQPRRAWRPPCRETPWYSSFQQQWSSRSFASSCTGACVTWS